MRAANGRPAASLGFSTPAGLRAARRLHWLSRMTTKSLVGITAALVAAACGPAGDHPGIALAPQSIGQALCPGGATLQGVDVSSYQGSINWSQAAGAGIAWGYAKATEGDG